MAPSRTKPLFNLLLSVLSGWLLPSDLLPHGLRMTVKTLRDWSACSTWNKQWGQGTGTEWQGKKVLPHQPLSHQRGNCLPESPSRVLFLDQNWFHAHPRGSPAKKTWISYNLFSDQIRVLLTTCNRMLEGIQEFREGFSSHFKLRERGFKEVTWF